MRGVAAAAAGAGVVSTAPSSVVVAGVASGVPDPAISAEKPPAAVRPASAFSPPPVFSTAAALDPNASTPTATALVGKARRGCWSAAVRQRRRDPESAAGPADRRFAGAGTASACFSHSRLTHYRVASRRALSRASAAPAAIARSSDRAQPDNPAPPSPLRRPTRPSHLHTILAWADMVKAMRRSGWRRQIRGRSGTGCERGRRGFVLLVRPRARHSLVRAPARSRGTRARGRRRTASCIPSCLSRGVVPLFRFVFPRSLSLRRGRAVASSRGGLDGLLTLCLRFARSALPLGGSPLVRAPEAARRRVRAICPLFFFFSPIVFLSARCCFERLYRSCIPRVPGALLKSCRP